MNDISEIFLIYIVGILLVLYIIFTACIIIKYKILGNKILETSKKQKRHIDYKVENDFIDDSNETEEVGVTYD